MEDIPIFSEDFIDPELFKIDTSIKLEFNKSVLELHPGFLMYFRTKQPCRWWRFWQWVFFGFEWSEVDDNA